MFLSSSQFITFRQQQALLYDLWAIARGQKENLCTLFYGLIMSTLRKNKGNTEAIFACFAASRLSPPSKLQYYDIGSITLLRSYFFSCGKILIFFSLLSNLFCFHTDSIIKLCSSGESFYSKITSFWKRLLVTYQRCL